MLLNKCFRFITSYFFQSFFVKQTHTKHHNVFFDNRPSSIYISKSMVVHLPADGLSLYLSRRTKQSRSVQVEVFSHFCLLLSFQFLCVLAFPLDVLKSTTNGKVISEI